MRKTIDKKCKYCGKIFQALLYEIKRGGGEYCSRKCVHDTMNKKDGWGVKTRFIKGQRSSPKTEFKKGQLSGEKHFNWNGGKRIVHGYVYIYSPEHPFRDEHNVVSEHRLIMEKYLGRYLTKKEVVHHINRIKTDNRIENLYLCKNNSEHIKIHKSHSFGGQPAIIEDRAVIPVANELHTKA